MDIHRERSRGANRVEDIEVYASSEEQELVRSDDTPESALETEEKRIVIRRAIANLPTRLRETFILHFYQELPYLEIAQQQEICYQNVCKRISQARKILREELKGYFIGEEGMDKSVPPTATESAIGEMSQGNAPVEPTVGETVTLSVAVEEVESVGDSEAIEAVRDVQHSDSVMVAATCEEKLEVRSGSCRCVEATLCERQFAPILANAQFDEKTGRWGNSCLAALRKQQHQVKKKWREFVRSSRSPPSGIAADSAHASPLYSLPLPQPDPPTLQKPLTRLPLTSQPSPLPTPTPPEAFPNQGGSLDTATANRRGRFDGETPRRGESYEFLHRSDESPAPGLPQDERQLTSLYSSVSKTTSLHSSSVESTPQDSLCFETNSAGELENSPDTITVSRFEFVINHLAKTDEELKNFTRDYLNKPLSPAQLLSVATLITKYYVARGFITSHAIVCIPKLTQQQGKGVVQIRVISGKFDRIDEKLSPAFQEEKKSGAAQSFSTSLSFDTILFSRLPTFQQKVVFSEANLLGIGDGLSVGYTHTEATNDWDISYTLPLNARDGTLSFAYSQSETYASESPSENIQEAGNSSGYELASRSYELTLRQPVKRSFWGESDRFKEQQPTHEELALGLTAFLGESSTTLSKVPFPFSSWSDDNGLTRTLALRFLMEWKRENAQEVIELRSQFSFGLNTFGSTTNEPNAQVNQVVLSNHFFSWQGQAQWSRFLAKDIVLLVRANAQLADGALMPLEQFVLGGKGSVRGYSQDFLLTDNGIFASAEVQLAVLRVFREKGVIQVVPFVDWGMVWNSSGRANPSPNSLASVGLGLQWQQGDFTARLDWGIPLVSVDSQDGTGQENGLYFSVQYNH